MNLLKILKGYLIFILIITAMASLTYVDSVSNFASGQFASVMHSIGWDEAGTDDSSLAYRVTYNWDELAEERGNFLRTGNMNENLVSFELLPEDDGAFAEPGTSGAAVMRVSIRTQDDDLELRKLKLKIEGVDSEQVKKGYLFDGQKLVGLGTIKGDYLVFKKLGVEVAKGERLDLSLRVDLGSDLSTGDRIRLDIENPEDLSIKVGGESYEVNAYYPMKGEYLSIARPRPWGPPKKGV